MVCVCTQECMFIILSILFNLKSLTLLYLVDIAFDNSSLSITLRILSFSFNFQSFFAFEIIS